MEYEVTVDGRKFRVRFFERSGELFVEHEGGTFPVKADTPLRSKVQKAQVNGGTRRFGYHRTKEGVQIVLDGAIYEAVVAELQRSLLAPASLPLAGPAAESPAAGGLGRVLGWLIWGQFPDIFTWIGIAVVCTSGIVIGTLEWRRQSRTGA